METESKIPRKRNPRESTNTLSALLFLYMIPIFRRNFKTNLKEEDLFEPLDEHKSNILGNKLENIWKEENKKHKRFALHRALFRLFGFELMLIGILKLLKEMVLITVMPFAIGGLVSYFEKGYPQVTKSEGYLYAGLIIMCLIMDGFINHPTVMAMLHISMKMRVSCCSLIYRKSLKLSRTALAKTTIGQIVNLLSNDVSKFDQTFILCHYVWIAPIQTAVGTYLVYKVIGVSAFSGIFFLLLFIPMQVYFGKKMSAVRMKTALRTDERVRLMNEILNAIQVIKMYTWEKPFAKLVSIARRHEIKVIRIRYFLQAIMFSAEKFATRTSIFISIIVFLSLGNHITAKTVYAITAIYTVLRPGMTIWFPVSIASLAEVHISLKRIQTFLGYQELPQSPIELVENENSEIGDHLLTALEKPPAVITLNTIPRVTLKNLSAKWLEESIDNTLTDISFTIDRSQLVAVIGPVGSGKSSLLNVILKEFQILNGIMEVVGKISYACQESWLFSSSVRQNILFGEIYEEGRYKAVVKICALDSDFTTLPYGDRTSVGEKGKALSGGQKARINLARCIYKQADIYLLDDPLSAVDTKVGKQLYESIRKFLYDKICILVTHQLQYLKSADKIIILKQGKIIGQGNYDELQKTGLDFAKLLHEFNAGGENEVDNHTIKSRQNSEMPEDENGNNEDNPNTAKEELLTGRIKASVYATYFKSGGSYFVVFLLLMAYIASQAAGNGGDYYVSYWVNLEQKANELKKDNSSSYQEVNRDSVIYIYSGIIAVTIILAIGHILFHFMFCMRASVNMHDNIFENVSHATMRFFNANPTGRILNRFSKDMGIIDEYIPSVLADFLEIGLLLIGTITLTTIVNTWLILPASVLLFLFYLLRLVYLETSRTVKRIEAITRSPIFTHMTATMHGLSTIRAFSAQTILLHEFDQHQDLHSSAWYLFISASRAFGFWLDIMCITLISLITISLVIINRGYYGGDVGLIITQYISLTGALQWGMRQWCELENQMTSVERVLEYTKVETEPIRRQLSILPKNWPEFGKIIFQNVVMRYNIDEAPVLKNLNFCIHPREKIGIVGRTGAGKTSTIAALFQLYNIEGSIIIDGVDTTKLNLEELRSKISIIPQEPALFSGTMRDNLDPFEEYDDETLWNALEQVELKQEFSKLSAGLKAIVSESGSNYSIGQRQLVCLARAIIRKNKILVMDEATANVDPHTDALIQKTIRKKFADCTVITIAHRLHTIMDSDKVLVMEAGKMVEFDHPYRLLEQRNSIFYTMVYATGETASKNLEIIAEENFRKRNNT